MADEPRKPDNPDPAPGTPEDGGTQPEKPLDQQEQAFFAQGEAEDPSAAQAPEEEAGAIPDGEGSDPDAVELEVVEPVESGAPRQPDTPPEAEQTPAATDDPFPEAAPPTGGEGEPDAAESAPAAVEGAPAASGSEPAADGSAPGPAGQPAPLATERADAGGEPEAQFPPVELAGDANDEPLPVPGGPGSHPAPFDPRQTPAWQALLAEYEREIAAIGDVPAAAPLYYEAGKILEEKLSQPHNAWDNYKKAFQLNPRLTPNIRAARRLASQMGNWNSTVLVLDSELQATDDPHEKAYLYLRRGRILEEKLGKIEDALSAYEAAASLTPDNIEILKQLERLSLSTGDWKAVLELRSRQLELIQDPAVRIQLLLSCARIHQLEFQGEQEAEGMYQRVLEIEPDNLQALGFLRTMYAGQNRYEELLDVLQREAGATAEPAMAAWLHYQAARLLREQLGDEDRAIEALQRALGLSSGNHMVLAEMAHIYENLMRWQELADVYEQQVQVITDRQELVSLYFKLGSLWEEKLFNEDRAIQHYRKVVELNPNYLPALQALGKLFYRKGQWNELVQMYEIEIRETQDPKPKSIRLYKLAEILEERLSRDEEAIAKLEQCLELNPGYLPALKSLGRLYNKYNRWESLIHMYENELGITPDQDQRIFLLDKIGGLWEEKLNNIDKAIETYQRLLEESPNYLPAIRTLGKLYVRADRWEDMIRINDLEAQLVNDQKQVVSLLHRNGEIYEEKLNDKDQAIEMYKQVLALAPNYLPALQSLGRLYFIKGRWDDLIGMHRQEIEVTQNEDQQITLLYKIGELYEEKLLQEDKAIVAYQEVLRIQESNFPAMKALIRIFTNKRDWENLIEICEREAKVLDDPQQKALALFRIAEIWENHLDQTEKAIETLQQILQVVPSHAPAIHSLVRLYTREQKWRELIGVHEREMELATHEVQQVQIMSRIAEIYTTRVNDLVRAAEFHEKILALKPDHLPSIEALERIYLSQRNYNALVRVYETYTTRSNDPQLTLALQSQIADMKENRLQPPQNAGENHLRILSLDPGHVEATRSLDILFTRFGTWHGLRRLYEQELKRYRGETGTAQTAHHCETGTAQTAHHCETGTAQTAAKNLDAAVDLCMRIADLAENRLQLPDVARHYYQQALRLSPDFLPAIKALKRISLAQGDHESMIGLLDREGRVSRDPRQAITTLLQAAQIYLEQSRNPHRAVECLFKVLEKDPREVQAFAQLESLLSEQEDFERLAVLYKNRIGVTEDNRVLLDLHLKLGALMRERLERPQDAAASYKAALEINPSNIQALTALAGLAFEAEDWPEAVQLSSRLMELTSDPQLLAECHQRLGIIFQEKQPDLDQAVHHFQKVLESNPADIQSLERLKAIHIARQKWQDAIDVLQRLIEADARTEQQVHNYLEMARICEDGINEPEQAVAAYRKVQDLDPNNVGVIQKLGELYERLERWQDLIDSYHAFIQLLPPERIQDAVPLYMKMGALFDQKLENTDKAIIEYKRVVEINPRHADAHEALATLYGRTGLYYANAIDEHRKLLEINAFRIDSYHELRRIFEEQRAFDKVLCVCSVLHYLRAADQNEEFFFGENRGKVAERSDQQLRPEDFEGVLLHPDEKGILRDIIKLVGPHLSKIYPPDLARHGVGKGDRSRPDDPLRTLCNGMVANLGELDYELYHSTQPTHLVAIENTSPPSMIVGEGLIKRTVGKEQRFALGRAIKMLFDGSFLPVLLGAKELARLVAAVVQPFHPGCPAVTYPAASLEDLPKRVAKAVPRKNRKQIEDLMHDRAPDLARLPDYEAYLRGVRYAADRFGLLMCNDLPQAIMHMIRSIPELRDQRLNSTEEIAAALSRHTGICELLRFAVSEEYFRLRAKLKFSIVS